MTYTWKKRTYGDLFALGREMYLDSDSFAKELRKEPLLSFLSSLDRKKYESITRLSLQSIPDDVFVFKASYLLNPFMSLRIKGRLFPTYQDLGRSMLMTSPNPDPTLLELVRYSLITEQMQNVAFQESHPDIYGKILELERYSGEDLLYSYFAIAYTLSGSTSILYDGREFQDTFNLCYFLCRNESDLETLGATLSVSPLLRAYQNHSKDRTDIALYLHLCEECDSNQKALDEFLEKRKVNLS